MFAIISLVAVVLLAGGGAAWWFLSGSSETATDVGAVTVNSYPAEPVGGAEIHADELVSGGSGVAVVGAHGDQLIVMALGYDKSDNDGVGVLASVSAIDGSELWSTDLTELYPNVNSEGSPQCSVEGADIVCLGWSGDEGLIAHYSVESGEVTAETPLAGSTRVYGLPGSRSRLLLDSSTAKRRELTAYDTTTGADLWSVDPSDWTDDDVADLWSTPFGDNWLVQWGVTDDDGDYESRTQLLNGETGEVITAFDAPTSAAFPSDSVLFQVANQEDSFRGFARVDEQGTELWSVRGMAYPFHSGSTLLAVTKDGEIVSLNPETGEKLWETKKSFDGYGPTRVVGDRIYLSHPDSAGALNLQTGEAVSGVPGLYVAEDGSAVFTLDDGELIATSLSDNTKVWRVDLTDLDRDLDEGASGSVAAWGGRLVINSYARLVVLDPA